MPRPKPEHTLDRIREDRCTRLRALGDQIEQAQRAIGLLRCERDNLIRHWHDDGMTVGELATAAGLTRQGAYDAMARVQTASTRGR